MTFDEFHLARGAWAAARKSIERQICGFLSSGVPAQMLEPRHGRVHAKLNKFRNPRWLQKRGEQWKLLRVHTATDFLEMCWQQQCCMYFKRHLSCLRASACVLRCYLFLVKVAVIWALSLCVSSSPHRRPKRECSVHVWHYADARVRVTPLAGRVQTRHDLKLINDLV